MSGRFEYGIDKSIKSERLFIYVNISGHKSYYHINLFLICMTWAIIR